jgi:hypothetical protein
MISLDKFMFGDGSSAFWVFYTPAPIMDNIHATSHLH